MNLYTEFQNLYSIANKTFTEGGEELGLSQFFVSSKKGYLTKMYINIEYMYIFFLSKLI